MSGVEALARWNHPDARTCAAPRLRLAGRRVRLDRQAWRVGPCEGLRNRTGLGSRNGGGERLRDPVPPSGLCGASSIHSKKTGLSPQRLEIEITESTLLQEHGASSNCLKSSPESMVFAWVRRFFGTGIFVAQRAEPRRRPHQKSTVFVRKSRRPSGSRNRRNWIAETFTATRYRDPRAVRFRRPSQGPTRQACRSSRALLPARRGRGAAQVRASGGSTAPTPRRRTSQTVR